MKSISDLASTYLRSVYKGHLDGFSVFGLAIILLTQWTRLFLWTPQDRLTLSVELLVGIAASLVYAAWTRSYFRTRVDLQQRSTPSYRRLRGTAILLGVLFMCAMFRWQYLRELANLTTSAHGWR